jgi:flagellum-specific ATP synthase
MLELDLDRLRREIAASERVRVYGTVTSVNGIMRSTLPAALGDQCEIITGPDRSVTAEVIGFTDGTTHIVPYETPETISAGMAVARLGKNFKVPVGRQLLGRVLDGLGRPLDGLGPLQASERRPLRTASPAALTRARIRHPFVTGQRAIDGLLTCGRGQRVGIFSGSGVGKSMLLGEIAKNAESDVNVITLVGERGREVKPFLDDCLGDKGRARSVVITATCDEPALMRIRAARVAVTIADYFREQGQNVLFLLDSLTRMAMAQRELGLSLGEPPSARGYTPSVFQLLATLIECLGNSDRGSITGILTVLVDGDDLDEPISDAVRSLVDGHIVLDRRLAEKGHYPAIDIARSISRVAHDIIGEAHRMAAQKVRAIMAVYAEVEDLIRIGAYARGASPQIDKAIELRPIVDQFLRQAIGTKNTFAETRAALEAIAARWPY